MKQYLELIEQTLTDVLTDAEPKVLFEAMRYAVGTGGKRIRPIICLASAQAVGGQAEDAKYPAAAIELLHNYTLVHDDLPAMDNDTLRRGQPTVWTKYGEANAILVGDALQALAFRTASRAPRNIPAIIDVLGEMGVGVVRGQVADIDPSTLTPQPSTPNTQSPTPNPQPSTSFIYEHKTSDLFIAAAKMGALAGGGSAEEVAKLGEFALNLGLAFQYEDDLLDGDSPYPENETRQLVDSTTARAIAALASLSGDTAPLSTLAQKLVFRAT